MKIFISYSTDDSELAVALYDALEEIGFECWLAERSISPSEDYLVKIPKAIEDCDVFLLLVTESSQKSPWVIREMNYAFQFPGKIKIPFIADQSEMSPPFKFCLGNIQWIFAYDRLQEAYEELVERLVKLGGMPEKLRQFIAEKQAAQEQAAQEQALAQAEPVEQKEPWWKTALWGIGGVAAAITLLAGLSGDESEKDDAPKA